MEPHIDPAAAVDPVFALDPPCRVVLEPGPERADAADEPAGALPGVPEAVNARLRGVVQLFLLADLALALDVVDLAAERVEAGRLADVEERHQVVRGSGGEADRGEGRLLGLRPEPLVSGDLQDLVGRLDRHVRPVVRERRERLARGGWGLLGCRHRRCLPVSVAAPGFAGPGVAACLHPPATGMHVGTPTTWPNEVRILEIRKSGRRACGVRIPPGSACSPDRRQPRRVGCQSTRSAGPAATSSL